MPFNSIGFLLFFTVFFLLYWFAARRSLKAQNYLLLFGSYFFYACCNWRFSFLLALSSLLTYFFGLAISGTEKPTRRRFFLVLGLAQALIPLLLFKYLDFFNGLLTIKTLDLVLPLG